MSSYKRQDSVINKERPNNRPNEGSISSRETAEEEEEDTRSCWTRFKSIFNDRGFDIEREYGGNLVAPHLQQRSPTLDAKNHIGAERRLSSSSNIASISSDGELSGVINFYDNFAHLGSEDIVSNERAVQEDRGRYGRGRKRVSMRPSMYLTNIQEESATTDEESRLPPPTAPPALLYAPPEPLDLVYACGERGSRVAGAAGAAAARLGGELRAARSARDALDALAAAPTTHVLVADARLPHLLDALQLARSVRGMKNTHHLFLVAVVKKNAYLKDDFAILPYIEAGFNRVMVETTVIAAWCAELVQARASAAATRASLAAVAALAAAVDRCRDLVAVTDETQKILFTSRSWRTTLGWRGEESGRALGELAAGEALRAGAREWEAPLALRRRAAPDPLLVPCRGAAVAVAKSTSHLVFVCPALGPEAGARGSLHSVRRGSLDVRSIASEGLRRTSLAKLQGMPLEAPITKVISLLSAATDGATPQTVALVERAVDILRTTELYSPQMRDDQRLRTDDPIANDLIGALLSQGPTNVLSSRRSSNDSTAVRAIVNRQNIKHKAPNQLRELLDTSLSWDFEIFKLEELTRSRPLLHLGLAIMAGRFDACQALECDERTLLNWLTVIEMNYHTKNTYHNSTHAADVLQSVAYFLEKDRLKYLLEPLEAAAALLAAAAHDVDHPGTSSAFLCNARHPLAVLYNDLAVLESHHAALTFKLTLNDDRVNIFKNLDRETYKMVRHNIVDMILATEMTKHFEHLAKFVNVFYAKTVVGSKEDDIQNEEPLSLDTTALLIPENIVLVKRMMIKCADVSNASRPAKFAFEWARRIAEEYFLQTDEEKSRELPVVMPMFDRASCSIPRSQIGFIDFIIIDMMEAWAAFIDMPELVNHARRNYQHWREMDEQGVTSPQDLRHAQQVLQHSLSAAPTKPASMAE